MKRKLLRPILLLSKYKTNGRDSIADEKKYCRCHDSFKTV